MSSFFKSEIGKEAVMALYDQKLADLGINYDTIMVSTRFGQTHILVTGPEDAPPLVVLHGSNGCAPIALEAYPSLAEHYRVYAIDVLAQPNKSNGERLDMSDLSYGHWLNQILGHLDLQAVTLLGFSFGGLIILKTLAQDGARIKSACLAAPAYIVNGHPLRLLWKMFIPMKRYMWSRRQKYARQVVQELFTDEDPFALQYLSQVFLHFDMDFTPVPVISKEEARRIKTPITLYAAKNDLMFPGEKMIKRSRSIFPSLEKAVLLEHSRHVQGRSQNQRIEQEMLQNRKGA